MPVTLEPTASPPSVLKKLFYAYDKSWRRRHDVQPFDKVLSLAIEPYRGQPRTLDDGTRLEPGDRLGIIHFNHDGFSADRNRLRAALRFRRDLAKSLRQLAQSLDTDPRLQAVKALYGESWIPPHGRKVGFMVEPLPKTWRTRLQHRYVRLLLWVQFPHLARDNRNTWLYAYWLTRCQWQVLPERLNEHGSESDDAATD